MQDHLVLELHQMNKKIEELKRLKTLDNLKYLENLKYLKPTKTLSNVENPKKKE